jgi:hypothetical protein
VRSFAAIPDDDEKADNSLYRFTELIQQDHENERAESQAKTGMDEGEEKVEKGFSGESFAAIETETGR